MGSEKRIEAVNWISNLYAYERLIVAELEQGEDSYLKGEIWECFLSVR